MDGELWVGYDTFNELLSIRTTTEFLQNKSSKLGEIWKDVQYCVFDAPMHPGHYIERHGYATESISDCNPNIRMIPIEVCMGVDHLKASLQLVTKKKGEGLMLYHPTSPYTSGRTPNLLKVKAYEEEDVKFLSCNPNSYSYLCEQQNGVKVIVKCSGWDYMYPPSSGTVITVKHSGHFKTSLKLKYPFLLRVRTDLNWEELLQTSQDS
uniref:ATP-dependent DNA ligase family profile domain-containing protein n=1 Tax=Arcella intermedia TaxID=1963864 RepID=A0A6B2LG80_9EUKA